MRNQSSMFFFVRSGCSLEFLVLFVQGKSTLIGLKDRGYKCLRMMVIIHYGLSFLDLPQQNIARHEPWSWRPASAKYRKARTFILRIGLSRWAEKPSEDSVKIFSVWLNAVKEFKNFSCQTQFFVRSGCSLDLLVLFCQEKSTLKKLEVFGTFCSSKKYINFWYFY